MADPHGSIAFSIILPALDEEQAIETVIGEIREQCRGHNPEIIVVASGSDQTAKIAARLGACVISMPARGYGAAIRAGLSRATNDIIMTADCDNTYPMQVIPTMLRVIADKSYDLVTGNRMNASPGQQMPLLNAFANRAFALFVRNLYGISVRDVTTGMLCFRREVIDTIRPVNALTFPVETIIKSHQAGFTHRELDIPYRTRIGRSKLKRWRGGCAVVRCIANYRFRLNIDPEKM